MSDQIETTTTASASSLTAISEVFETNKIELANEYLNLGWIFVGAFTYGDARTGQSMYYTLGWLRTKGEVVKPKSKYDKFQ